MRSARGVFVAVLTLTPCVSSRLITMGGSQSIARYSNDFELVIRATKELEFLLETHFLPPLTMSQDKTIGLHDKISMARINGKPLPDHAIRKMRFLVTLRNKIVHDHECNSIPDRPRFVKDFDEVEKSLRELLPDDKGSGCAIS